MTFTPPSTMRALRTQHTKHKSVAVETVPLHLSDDDESATQLTPDEVLVRVRAVGINPTDAKHALGTGAEDWGSAGLVCGCDGAGDVFMVGGEVKDVNVGDRVAGFAYGTHHPTNGSYAEYVRYRASATLALPAAMSYAQGAALPIPHMTAVQALYMRMHLPPPSQGGAAGRMLIWGGGTAVGHHAIQLAKLSGLDVVAVASKSNHEALKSLGASHCVDYHDSDVVKQIQAVGKIEYGLDCVVEKGSTKNMIDAMQGGHIVLLLPPSDEDTAAQEANGGKLEMTLAYTVIGRAITFAKVMPFPAMPEDRKAIAEWSAKEFPALFEGWKQEANRSGRFVGATLREMPGGLEGVEKGFRDSLEGKVRAEKLVYTL